MLVLVTCSLAACASTASRQTEGAGSGVAKEVDPWEGFNRAVFRFNMTLDRWILKPVAKGYDAVLPDPVQKGVGNFFDNIGEVGNIANDVFQWKWKQAGNDTGRLLTNSTLGLFGIFDVASKFGLDENDGEDVGQTFEKWGVKSGPYLVLPIFGPSTVREAISMPVDYVLDPVTYVDPVEAKYGLSATRIVDERADLLDIEDLASGDLYLFVREAYLQRRSYLEKDGEMEDEQFLDDFGDEEEW